MALAVLEFAVSTRLASTQKFTCLYLLKDGIKACATTAGLRFV